MSWVHKHHQVLDFFFLHEANFEQTEVETVLFNHTPSVHSELNINVL